MSGPLHSSDLAPFDILRPKEWTTPLVFASPHSGRNYPDAFVQASRLDPIGLRRSEDAFVDELFAAAPDYGAPLLLAQFPRVFIDPNRERFELDPDMFEDAMPSHVNTSSPRVASGLGTMAKVVTSGEEVYRGKLRFKDAVQAIEATYVPYHEALKGLLDEAQERFGCCLLIDCHSMPSIGGPMDRDPGFSRVDFILGDRHGTSCGAKITDKVEHTLKSMDYVVTRNTPYAGGFTTAHYGHPEKKCHALQIEINRALYMNELMIRRTDGFGPLKDGLNKLLESLSQMDCKSLAS